MHSCSGCLNRLDGPYVEVRAPNGSGFLRLAFCVTCWPAERDQLAAALEQEQYTARLCGSWASLVEQR